MHSINISFRPSMVTLNQTGQAVTNCNLPKPKREQRRCGVVWCGVVWCGVVWCGVVCRRRYYQMAMAGVVLHLGNASREGCVCGRALCVVCCAPVRWPEPSPCLGGLVHGRPGDSLPLCLLVQLQFP